MRLCLCQFVAGVIVSHPVLPASAEDGVLHNSLPSLVTVTTA